MPKALAIDLGTSSIRASVYDGRLRRLPGSAHLHYAWRLGGGGAIDAPAARLERVLADAIDRAVRGHARIDAVGIAAFWHSLIGVDRHGRAVTPVLPWSDTRSAEDADDLRGRLNERAAHARTGCRLHPTYWPSRMRWFARCDPGTFRRVHRWMSFPAYIESRWLGRAAESRSQASGTGLFVHEGGRWDAAVCAAAGITPEHLLPIVDLDDGGAALAPRLAARWPALRHARWVPAAGDGALNTLGADCIERGRATLMIGTSGALRLCWRTETAPRVPFTLWRYWLDRSRVVVGGALSSGGNLAAWMHDTLGVPLDRRLDARIDALEPDAHGLTLLPFWAGERSPDYLPDARGAIAGLRLATSRDDIMRAGLEGIAYRFRAVLHELDRVSPVRLLVGTGTALTASPAWARILADALERPLAIPREPELTSRGAAIVALEQLGIRKHAPLALARTVRPDRRRSGAYADAAARQQRLLDALNGKFL